MKILILRFSSFGDVTQCLSVVGALHRQFPQAEIHWATRQDMAPLVKHHPGLTRMWTLDKKTGAGGLWKLILQLKSENFTHIYDAHNSLRSRLIGCGLRFFGFPKIPVLLRRPIYRMKRFLLFRFRINRFKQPFSGQRDLLEPLANWGVAIEAPPTPQIFFDSECDRKALEVLGSFAPRFVALAPSAAFFLKRWPTAYWEELISLFPNEKFVLMGGPEDRFLVDIEKKFPDRVLNSAGKSDYGTTVAIVHRSQAVVSNDTGLLHVAEQLGKRAIALMGPAPFGFPSRPSTKILELKLSCRPCSKHGQGPCTNKSYHQCLVEIRPQTVATELRKILT